MFLVRHKVKELIEIVQDDQRLRDERKKAKKSRDKYKGVSSDEVARKYDYSKFLLQNVSPGNSQWCCIKNVEITLILIFYWSTLKYVHSNIENIILKISVLKPISVY